MAFAEGGFLPRPTRPGAGRPPAMDDSTRQMVLETYWTQLLSVRQIAKMFGVSHMSVWRLVTTSPRPVF